MISKTKITEYILEEFYPDSTDEEIKPDMDLIGTGVIDSMGILKLVAYLERASGITIEVEELDMENFKTINAMYQLVEQKRGGERAVFDSGDTGRGI